jgi:Trp operon repressor
MNIASNCAMWGLIIHLVKLEDETDNELLRLRCLELEIERDQLVDRVHKMRAALADYRRGLENWKKIAIASRELLSVITESHNY